MSEQRLYQMGRCVLCGVEASVVNLANQPYRILDGVDPDDPEKVVDYWIELAGSPWSLVLHSCDTGEYGRVNTVGWRLRRERPPAFLRHASHLRFVRSSAELASFDISKLYPEDEAKQDRFNQIVWDHGGAVSADRRIVHLWPSSVNTFAHAVAADAELGIDNFIIRPPPKDWGKEKA